MILPDQNVQCSDSCGIKCSTAKRTGYAIVGARRRTIVVLAGLDVWYSRCLRIYRKLLVADYVWSIPIIK